MTPGKNVKNFQHCAISLNMVDTGGLCVVLGFTAPFIIISKKLQSKYIYKLNSAFRAPIARAAIKQLLLGGDRHRSCLPTLWELRLIIFWLISWTPYTNVSFCNILSTLSRFIRLCKMNVQDFVIFVMLGAI